MTLLSLLSHLIFALLLTATSVLVTHLMLKRVRIMDVPNVRSSHEIPTPRGGGVAIVLSFFLGLLAIYMLGDKTMLAENYFWAFLFSAILIAGISFYDDITNQSFKVKILTQLIEILLTLAFGIVLDELATPFGLLKLGIAGYLLTLIWMVGLTNAFNFMDGIDGLAASTAVIVCAFFAYITFNQGSLFIYICSYTVLAGSLGFLLFNRPPAKIFMGDVGSAFLGFVFAAMAIIAARYDHSHTSFLVMPLLLSHFIFDTAFTMGRRLLAGEDITQAHRTHIYQLLVRMGASHGQVTSVYCLLGVIQGFAAVWMVNIPGDDRLWIFVPFLVAYSVAAAIVVKRAKRLSII